MQKLSGDSFITDKSSTCLGVKTHARDENASRARLRYKGSKLTLNTSRNTQNYLQKRKLSVRDYLLKYNINCFEGDANPMSTFILI